MQWHFCSRTWFDVRKAFVCEAILFVVPPPCPRAAFSSLFFSPWKDNDVIIMKWWFWWGFWVVHFWRASSSGDNQVGYPPLTWGLWDRVLVLNIILCKYAPKQVYFVSGDLHGVAINNAGSTVWHMHTDTGRSLAEAHFKPPNFVRLFQPWPLRSITMTSIDCIYTCMILYNMIARRMETTQGRM